jgi:GNAT superfamily N-acetyltransferase
MRAHLPVGGGDEHNRRMTSVRLATTDEIPDLAAVLARAFVHDPFYAWLAGDAPERTQRMRDGWTGILRYSSAHLSDTYTTDDRAGVAIWLPPGYRGPSVLDGLRQMPALARLAGWRRLRTVGDAMAALEERRRDHVPEPHFYLSALGVEPERQGEGIGTALMQPVLDRCDRDRTAAYLETAVARNVLLYERLGFDVVEEMDLPGTDIHGWLMLRPAGSDADPARYQSPSP